MHQEQPREGRAIREDVSGSAHQGSFICEWKTHMLLFPARPLWDLMLVTHHRSGSLSSLWSHSHDVSVNRIILVECVMIVFIVVSLKRFQKE